MQIHIPFLFCILKENSRMGKMVYRSERMGHNTCKSIGRVLCVVRRYELKCLTCRVRSDDVT